MIVKESTRCDKKSKNIGMLGLPLFEMMVLVATTMTGQLNLPSRWLTTFSLTLRKAFN